MNEAREYNTPLKRLETYDEGPSSYPSRRPSNTEDFDEYRHGPGGGHGYPRNGYDTDRHWDYRRSVRTIR